MIHYRFAWEAGISLSTDADSLIDLAIEIALAFLSVVHRCTLIAGIITASIRLCTDSDSLIDLALELAPAFQL